MDDGDHPGCLSAEVRTLHPGSVADGMIEKYTWYESGHSFSGIDGHDLVKIIEE